MRIARVTVERHGGFTGIPMSTVLAVASLPAADRAKLTSLVQAAGFFGPPATGSHGAPQPDRFQYAITVLTDDGAAQTIQADEAGLSAELHQLIALVRDEATRHTS